MKKKVSIVSLLLAGLMACSTLAGCGAPAESTASGGTASASGTAAGQTGEKPVLKQLMMNTSEGDYNTYPVAKAIEEMTGYKVQYDMLPQDAPMDKLNLIMASEEEYDMVTIGGDTARVMEYAQNNALVDINPYLEKAPNLNAAISDYARETFTLDGGLYAIGMDNLSFDGKGEVRELLFTRQDWLDALGLKVPTTTEEFQEMLRAYKNYDSGTGNKVIPMTLTGTNVSVGGLMGAFGIPNEWNEVDGKLVYRGADPRMKDYLAYLKGLYEEGLLDAEFPANKTENQKEKYTTGVAGTAYFGFWDCPSLYDTMDKTQPGHVQAFIPPLTGPNGDVGIGTNIGGFDRITFIPKTSKHVEDVMQFMNSKLEEDNFRNIVIGEENVHYTVDENGEYWPIKPIFFEERNLANSYTTGRLSSYPEYWMCRNKKNERQWDCWVYMNRTDAITSVNVVNEASAAPAFPETSKNKQSLDQMLLDQQIKMIAGTESVDSYDAFLEEWMAAGGEAMTKEYNDWWSTRQ